MLLLLVVLLLLLLVGLYGETGSGSILGQPSMFRFSAISRVRRLPTKRGKSTKSNGVKARMSRNMTEQERPTFIPDRQWQHTRLQTLLDNGTMAMDRTQTTFTIVSYNILAQVSENNVILHSKITLFISRTCSSRTGTSTRAFQSTTSAGHGVKRTSCGKSPT